MKPTVFELFPVNVYENYISREAHEQAKNISNKLIYDYPEKLSFHGNTHKINKESYDDFDGDVLSQYNMDILEKEIMNNVYNFLKSTNCTNFEDIPRYRRTSWITKFEHKNYAVMHDHGNADISGVYYIESSEKDGNFIVENPNRLTQRSILRYNHSDSFIFPPKERKLLIFNSWLKHGVGCNETNKSRLSLSFNIEFSL